MPYRQRLSVALTPATGVLLWPWRTANAERQLWAVDPLVKVRDGDRPGGGAAQTVRINARFDTCSAHDLTADGVIEFLDQRATFQKTADTFIPDESQNWADG
jgi:hypothetical protein